METFPTTPRSFADAQDTKPLERRQLAVQLTAIDGVDHIQMLIPDAAERINTVLSIAGGENLALILLRLARTARAEAPHLSAAKEGSLPIAAGVSAFLEACDCLQDVETFRTVGWDDGTGIVQKWIARMDRTYPHPQGRSHNAGYNVTRAQFLQLPGRLLDEALNLLATRQSVASLANAMAFPKPMTADEILTREA